ncbi:MAG: DNA-binding protein [Methanobacterium sp.]|nr:MAG: DNA-binding protein [Methanobacterium sp.]
MLVFRITPGKDLKNEIESIQKKNNLEAGIIIGAVGSLQKAVLRLADEEIIDIEGPLEIICANGTVSPEGIHLHLAVADKTGKMTGGHLKEGSLVNTTVELSILEYEGTFKRIMDPETGFKELVILN